MPPVTKTPKKRIFLKILAVTLFVIIVVAIAFANKFYKKFHKTNLSLPTETVYLYIPTNSTFVDVKTLLYENNYVIDKKSFEWFSKKKNYVNKVKPGRYLLESGMTNNQLINKLRSGVQSPVKVVFNNIRTKEQFASRISNLLEFDSLSFINLLNDNQYLKDNFKFTPDESLILFLPNTYEFYWNTSAKEFIERMQMEYKKFWTAERRKKASDAGLQPFEISILASIVQQETNKVDEMSRIAGVYVNRLNSGIPLQADPTVKFALGDFFIKRILIRHTKIISPYNTYQIIGLPPGPICMPEPITIDKVLNYENHNYYYFCAKDDFLGYHVFSKTHRQHLNNANKYHRALNRLKIR